MADAIRVSGPVSGTDQTLSFETGKLAQQSQGAVVAGLGRTTVLATAVVRPLDVPLRRRVTWLVAAVLGAALACKWSAAPLLADRGMQ